MDEEREIQLDGARALSPSEIKGQRGRFDQMAAVAVHTVSRGPFFVGCVLGVLVWLALGILSGFSDTWLAAGSTAMSVILMLRGTRERQSVDNQAIRRLNHCWMPADSCARRTSTTPSDELRCGRNRVARALARLTEFFVIRRRTVGSEGR